MYPITKIVLQTYDTKPQFTLIVKDGAWKVEAEDEQGAESKEENPAQQSGYAPRDVRVQRPDA